MYLAASMKEAREVEGLLTENGVDYVVQVESLGVSLFGSPRSGAVFYVSASQAEYCRVRLATAALRHGVVNEEPAE